MYIFKNAIKSITRSKGRNILIGIIIVMIATSSCISLSIRKAAAEIVSGYEEGFEITASIVLDRDALREQAHEQGTNLREIMVGMENPGIDQILLYGESEYLNYYTYTISSSFNSSRINPLTAEESENNTDSGENPQAKGGLADVMRGMGGVARGDFNVLGYSSINGMTNFINGNYQITQGSVFEDGTQEAVCLITDELAYENELIVGDVIEFANPGNEDETYEFEIVGIYTDTTVEEASAMNWFSNSANQIITTYKSVEDVIKKSQDASNQIDATAQSDETVSTAMGSQLTSTFYLKNRDSISGFEEELKSKGLGDIYTVSTNLNSFEESLKPLTNLNKFATIFLWLVLLIGGIILFVLNMINIRERKYEIGVLRAIGMKKGKLAMQFITELLLVTFISIVIGSAIGSAASIPTASTLLKSEIESIQTSEQQIAQNFGREGSAGMPQGATGQGRVMMEGVFNPGGNVNYISQINAVINFSVLGQLVIIGIFLTMFSSIISIILISRYEPLKILSERS